MKELSSLSPSPGAKKTRKRVGRGPGSGLGKTSGRGHKGQGARSGKGRPPWFEGGQMPLQRRIPKRGFRSFEHKEYAIINVRDLNKFENDMTVDIVALKEKGLVRKIGHGVKILGGGVLKKKLTVIAHAFSNSAKTKIEKAGGHAQLVTEVMGV